MSLRTAQCDSIDRKILKAVWTHTRAFMHETHGPEAHAPRCVSGLCCVRDDEHVLSVLSGESTSPSLRPTRRKRIRFCCYLGSTARPSPLLPALPTSVAPASTPGGSLGLRLHSESASGGLALQWGLTSQSLPRNLSYWE